MGEFSQIALYTISGNNLFRQGIKNLMAEGNGITIPSGFKDCDSALNYFCHDSSFQKNNNVVFIEDLSLDKVQIINFVNKIHTCYRLNEFKTILYTKSVDAEYLNELALLNINGILHEDDTPLKAFLQALKEKKESNKPAELFHAHANGKLYDTIKLINGGSIYYDSRASTIISKHIWAKEHNNSLHCPSLCNEIVQDKRCLKDVACTWKMLNRKLKPEATERTGKFITGKKKLRALFISAAPVIIGGLISLFSDDAFIDFDTKEYHEIIRRGRTEFLNYDAIIYDDENNIKQQESLLNTFIYEKDKIELAYKRKIEPEAIIYTRSENILYLRRLIELKTIGLVHKTSPIENILEAIDAFYNGSIYLDPAICKKIKEYNRNISIHPLSKLTNSQLKVLNELAEGWKNKKIAENLFVTIKDVEKHRANIEHILDIKPEEIVHFAIKYREEIKYLLEFPINV